MTDTHHNDLASRTGRLRSTGGGRVRTAVVALVGLAMLAAIWATSEVSYLLFHSLVESAVIIVAAVIFAMSWSLSRVVPDSYATLAGVGLACVALIQLLHLLAYQGMGVFPNADTDLPTQLWIAARYLTLATFLLALFCGDRKLNVRLASAAFVAGTAALLCSIFWWQIFPTCYDELTGLTTFKKVSEYVIAGGFLVAAGIHLRPTTPLPKRARLAMASALTLAAAAEIAFTLYVGVYTTPNLVGHLLMLASILIVYQALVQDGLSQAYSQLVTQLETESTALAYLSTHDELTGLFNRRGFLETAGLLLNLARRSHQRVALFYCDDVGLKSVNDQHGHAAGDDVLVAAAGGLRRGFRDADAIARIGGDEFAVLALGPSVADCELMVARLHGILGSTSPDALAGHAPQVTVGVAVADSEHADIDTLLSAADTDMYRRRAERSAVPPAPPRDL